MSELSAEQLAQRIRECDLMPVNELETTLRLAGGRGRASFNDFIMKLLEQEKLTNWQISRLTDGHRRGYFYGEWKILYLIGAGTFARVYRAVHRTSGEIKAVKVLRQRYGSDNDTREQFLREARMVMKLRHPNIVPIFEVEEDKNRIYMVMDFVEGQNLREHVKTHQGLPYMTALNIIRDIASGLKYAAEHNITHRDMKLSNVLLSAKGQAKLVDFGLATVSGTGDDEKGGPRSIDYAGLERVTGVRRNDKRSDLFFVGCMLYNLVSGQPPLEETRERMKRLSAGRYQNIRPVTRFVPDLPHRIVILINHLMELDPSKRVQSPSLMLQQIESVIKAIESGDIKKYDEQTSEQDAQSIASKVAEADEGEGKTILIIESNVKVQDSLRERLKSIGYRVLITSDPIRGLSHFEDLDEADDCPADCVIFGCIGLGRQALTAFGGFAEGDYTSRIPAILIVPDKLEMFVNPKWLKSHRQQFGMPLKVKRLQKTLRKLLKLDDPNRKRPPKEHGPIVVNDPEAGTDVEDDDDD